MLGIILSPPWTEEVEIFRKCNLFRFKFVILFIKKITIHIIDQTLLLEIKLLIYRIQTMGLLVIFTWVPLHIGIKGNELAVKYANQATKSSYIIGTIK